MAFDIPVQQPPAPRRIRLSLMWQRIIAIAFIFIVAGICFLAFLFSAPRAFPTNSLITIPADTSAAAFARLLKEDGIIRSETSFRVLARLSGYDAHLTQGVYVFQKRTNLLVVLYRIGNGNHGIEPIKVTITEGMTTFDIANTLQAKLPGFDSEAFLRDASTSEGYLFPETYLFMPGDNPEDIVDRLKIQFSESIASITPEIVASKHSMSDIVILASILEREAKSPEDMRIVAGILWNRISLGMPLQVDAVFGYVQKMNGYTPTADDLKSDSPYNTYRNKGLPPTPISNPGIEALSAAASPASTKYLYYLTGKDGKMYYAKTFEEHKKNRQLYLDI